MRKLVKVKKTGLIQARITDVETFKSKDGLLCNKVYFTKDNTGDIYEGMVYGKEIQAPCNCVIKPGNKVGKEQFYDMIRLQ